MSVYANFGVSLPHSSSADRSQGAAVDGLANAQAGDLICYSGHVALYIGNGQIVHARPVLSFQMLIIRRYWQFDGYSNLNNKTKALCENTQCLFCMYAQSTLMG